MYIVARTGQGLGQDGGFAGGVFCPLWQARKLASIVDMDRHSLE